MSTTQGNKLNNTYQIRKQLNNTYQIRKQTKQYIPNKEFLPYVGTSLI